MYTPFRYIPDIAVRYGPRYDLEHFKDELEWTEGALSDFFRKQVRQTVRSGEIFMTYSKPIIIGLFAVIGFNLHRYIADNARLPVISRLQPYKWPMFALKFAIFFGGGLGYYNFIEKNFRPVFYDSFYHTVRKEYKLYKRSGDIRFLDPAINMYELPPIEF